MSRWWPKIVIAVAVLGAGGVGVWYYTRPQPLGVGIPCALTAGVDSESETYVGCNGGLCIRENDGTAYCSHECKTDQECPTGYVCEPTRSRRRSACMEEGADITPPDAGSANANLVFRRRRASQP